MVTASPLPPAEPLPSVGPLPPVEQLAERLVDTLRNVGDQWLWEMVWALNGEFGEVDVATKVALARQAVLDLTLKARVELWRGHWPVGPVAPLTQEEMAKILAEDAPWHDPENADLLVVIQQPEPS